MINLGIKRSISNSIFYQQKRYEMSYSCFYLTTLVNCFLISDFMYLSVNVHYRLLEIKYYIAWMNILFYIFLFCERSKVIFSVNILPNTLIAEY